MKKVTIYQHTAAQSWSTGIAQAPHFAILLKDAGVSSLHQMAYWNDIKDIEKVQNTTDEQIIFVVRDSRMFILNFTETRIARLAMEQNLIPLSWNDVAVQFETSFFVQHLNYFKDLFTTQPQLFWDYVLLPTYIECFKADILWDAHGTKTKILRSVYTQKMLALPPVVLLPYVGQTLSGHMMSDGNLDNELRLGFCYFLDMYAEKHGLRDSTPSTYGDFNAWCIWCAETNNYKPVQPV